MSRHAAHTLYLIPGLFIVAVWLAIHVGVVVWGISPVLDGAFLGPDSYMRLVRVGRLIATGAWFDGSIPRSNAPYGDVLHWTRPYDVLLIAGAAALAPFVGLDTGLRWFAAVNAPLLHLAGAAAVGWAAAPLAGRAGAMFAVIALLIQPAVISYTMAGRVDHHALQLVVFALVVGATVRCLKTGRALPVVAGGLLGFGIWLSVESLLLASIVYALLAIAWVLRGDARTPFAHAAAAAATIVVALLVERGPGGLFVEAYDQISVVHTLLAVSVFVYWGLARGLEHGGRGPRHSSGRLALAATGATAGGLLMLAVAPKFFAGPTVDIDPRLFPMWLDYVIEFKSVLPVDGPSLGRFLIYVGPVIPCLPFAMWLAWRERARRAGMAWLFLALGLGAYTVLALVHVRTAMFLETLVAVVLAALWRRTRRYWGRLKGDTARSAARALTALFLLYGFSVAGLSVNVLVNAPREDASATRCDFAALAVILEDPSRQGARQHVILGLLDDGPELLYRTRHAVVATPYHRNAAGILDSHRILAGGDDAESRRLIERRGIDLVVLCPRPSERNFFAPADESDGETLYRRLIDGHPPGWLRPVMLPGPLAAEFRVYEVVRG